MKARAICLEIFVTISLDELCKLEESALNNSLRFSPNMDDKEDYYIPMELRVVKDQKEDLVVQQTPENVYLGNAEGISFLINQEFYDNLARKYSHGQRFYWGGKLIVEVK